MYNIFSNAKFGDKFKTRDNRIAILLDKNIGDSLEVHFATYNKANFYIEYTVNAESGIMMQNGKEFKHYQCDLDIVSKWKEEINKEELDDLAANYTSELFGLSGSRSHILDMSVSKAYKAGYYKAKEN